MKLMLKKKSFVESLPDKQVYMLDFHILLS